MRKGLTRGWQRAGVAAGVTGLLIGTTAAAPATASPDDELIWEQGTVLSVSDGDTLNARLTSGPGLLGDRRIRTIGVQAPEVTPPVECGATQATERLRAQLPLGAPVQARSVQVTSNDDYSGGRIVRSLYAQDEEGNWYDTSRGTVSDGWLMWFPLAADSSNKPEWAHNLEYRVLADDAALEGRGLWSQGLCGPWQQSASGWNRPNSQLRVWAQYYGTEKVFVENRGPAPVDLNGWIIRDSAISGYRTLSGPDKVINPGEAKMVYQGDLNLNNLPADNRAFEGDAVYLLEPAGAFGTGNLRAWFPYPCNPDECGDPLVGQVSISKVQDAPPPVTKQPSAPGSVAATASTDGSGNVTVTWAAPADLQAPSVTYTITPSSTNGGAPLTPATGVTGLSHTFAGLTLGRAYSFSVVAVNTAGTSDAASTTAAVTPVGLPRDPASGQPLPVTDVVVEGRGSSALVSWKAPTGTGGEPPIAYTVTAAPQDAGPPRTCTTTDGSTSCIVANLVADGTEFTFTVTATLGSGTSAVSSAPTTSAYLPGAGPISEPREITALAGDRRAVVSWLKPASDGGTPITQYTIRTYGNPAGTGTPIRTTTCPTTSCVVTSLANNQDYWFVVNASSGPSSAPSATPARPFAYVPVQGPTTPSASPPPVANPYINAEYVELSNDSGDEVRLGGYGLWNTTSSNYLNGGSREDRAAYLFLADQKIPAGGKLRVYSGAVPPQQPPLPGGTTAIGTPGGHYIGGDGVSSTPDFVELANLNRAQVACAPVAGGSCRGSKPVAISSAPVGVTARTTPSSVAVAWGAPISRGGTPITQYTATAFDAPVGGNPTASCTAGGGERACSFPGGIGAKYYVEVVAHNAQGISGPSWRVLAAPRTVPSPPGSVAVSGTPGGLNVSWTPAAENGATITKYTASAYTAGTGGNPVGSCTTGNGSLSGCTIMKLQGGTQYYIDVVATNRAGNGAASSPRTPGTPGPGGAVSTYSKGKVTVRWDPPTPGSNTITGYTAKLYTKSKGGTKVGECSAPAGKTSCTTKKMKKRSKYYIDLTMQSAAGSFTVKPRIVTGPAKKASAPKVTSATASGRQVVVAWAPPTFNGYSYLKGYGARLYSKKKGGSVKASCSAGPRTLTCTTKSLKKKGTYYSAVRVKNSKGWSKWSKRVKVVVR